MGQEYSNDENGEIPTDQGGTEQDPSTTNLQDLSGYRVMKVFPGSPASRSGLHPFEDFIMALNGVMVISDKAALGNVLRANEGNEVGLSVWNCVDQVKRDVALRPVKWHGPGLLGAAVRYEPLQGAMEFVQRVIDVLPQSPADDAGLTPYTDYIVGTPAEVFRNNGDFQRLVCFHVLQTCSLLDYFDSILIFILTFICSYTHFYVSDFGSSGEQFSGQFYGILNRNKSNGKLS